MIAACGAHMPLVQALKLRMPSNQDVPLLEQEQHEPLTQTNRCACPIPGTMHSLSEAELGEQFMREEESLPTALDSAGVPIPAAAAARPEPIFACEECGAEATKYINVEGIKTHLCDGCAARHCTRPPDRE